MAEKKLSLEEKFNNLDEIIEKLEDKEQEWDLDQMEFVNQYYKELMEHKDKIKIEMDSLKDEIEKINKKCETKNNKYFGEI